MVLHWMHAIFVGQAAITKEMGRDCLHFLCDVVMNIGTIGMPGGCNPVPLDHEITGGRIVIDAANLDAEAYRFE